MSRTSFCCGKKVRKFIYFQRKLHLCAGSCIYAHIWLRKTWHNLFSFARTWPKAKIFRSSTSNWVRASHAIALNRFNIKFFRLQHQMSDINIKRYKTVIKTFFISWFPYCTSTTASWKEICLAKNYPFKLSVCDLLHRFVSRIHRVELLLTANPFINVIGSMPMDFTGSNN